MTTAYLLDNIPVRQLDNNSAPVPSAKLHTWVAGTTTPQVAYTDATATTPLSNPIVADPQGFWPQIWLLNAGYDLQARKSDDTSVLWSAPSVNPGAFASFAAGFSNTTDPAQGAGIPSFVYSLLYAALTTGWAMKLDTVKAAWFLSSVSGGDWVPALKAAHNYVALRGNGGFVELDTQQTYTCKSNLPWNTNKVGLMMNGALLDFSTVATNGFFGIDITQSDGDANNRNGMNPTHPFENGRILGPGSSVTATAVRGLDTNLIASVAWMPGVTFRGVTFTNWWRDVELNLGTFLWRFDKCVFNITGGGSAYDTSIYIPNVANSGENNSFDHCYFGKTYGSLLKQDNVNSSTFFRVCSADYDANIFAVTGGQVDWEGYIESKIDTDYWAKISGQNTLVRIAGIVEVTGNKSAFEMFSVDPSSAAGGLELDISLQFGGGVAYTSLNLCKGLTAATSGRVVAKLRAHSNVTVHPAIGGGCTALANGDFETAALTDWTLGGAVTPPARIGTPTPHSGSFCLRFAGSTTNTPSAFRSIPCRAGQQIIGSLWYQSQGLAASGGTFAVLVSYLDAGGAVLAASTALALTANVSTWTFLNINQLLPAPPGTASATLSISLFGTTSGAPNGYIDDATLAVV